MVPGEHELVIRNSPQLEAFFGSVAWAELLPMLKDQYAVDVEYNPDSITPENSEDGATITLLWSFTRNNAGFVRDAIEYFFTQLAAAGVETTTIRGSIPRPKSDSFEESLPYFDSVLLQRAPVSVATDSPTKTSFGDDPSTSRSTLFDKLRKPSSMASLSSFLDRRKNSSQSPSQFFKNGSSNVSKSSLISIESTRSFNADRNPWNDSGVNLADSDNSWPNHHHQFSNGGGNGNGADLHMKPAGTFMNQQHPGDATPRHNTRASNDSGRPSTSHSTNSGYPGPIGPPR